MKFVVVQLGVDWCMLMFDVSAAIDVRRRNQHSPLHFCLLALCFETPRNQHWYLPDLLLVL